MGAVPSAVHVAANKLRRSRAVTGQNPAARRTMARMPMRASCGGRRAGTRHLVHQVRAWVTVDYRGRSYTQTEFWCGRTTFNVTAPARSRQPACEVCDANHARAIRVA